MKKLTGYLYEVSDAPQYLGEYYVMVPNFMKGKIQTIMVGADSYRYVMDYNASELWYGRPSSGDIIITLVDGTIYTSGEISETPEPISENHENANPLTGYLYEASDAPGHLGEYYVMPPAFMKGKIQTIKVDQEMYRYVMDYNASELWYGKPGNGNIVITLIDGSVYTNVEIPEKDHPVSNEHREYGKWFGLTNGNRGTWYFSKTMNQYPSEFYLTVPGCLQKTLVHNNGHRWDPRGQPWYILKQSEVPGRTMGLIVPLICRSQEAFIEY